MWTSGAITVSLCEVMSSSKRRMPSILTSLVTGQKCRKFGKFFFLFGCNLPFGWIHVLDGVLQRRFRVFRLLQFGGRLRRRCQGGGPPAGRHDAYPFDAIRNRFVATIDERKRSQLLFQVGTKVRQRILYVVLSWRRVGRDLCRRAFSSGVGLEAANEATDRLLTGRRESSQSTSSSASSSYKFSSSSSSKTKGRLSGTGLWTTRGLLPTFSGRSSGCCWTAFGKQSGTTTSNCSCLKVSSSEWILWHIYKNFTDGWRRNAGDEDVDSLASWLLFLDAAPLSVSSFLICSIGWSSSKIKIIIKAIFVKNLFCFVLPLTREVLRYLLTSSSSFSFNLKHKNRNDR